MLRCNCKNYRASFRLCLFCYRFCLKRSIVLLSLCAFLPEPPMALHGAIMSISFLHTTYIEPAALPSYIAHLHQHFAIYLYIIKQHMAQNVKILKAPFVPSPTHHYFYTSHTSHPIRSCICNNHDHYISLMFIIYSLALNTQLATYTQRYENITMLTHSLDHTHHAPSIF